ncbi:hypothetical protein CDL15_Pgr008825 [Punica granatum]|uniref:Uncharacterized protein n=1 Tax=Punica granatum TaxID=22663 RepID=A0A218VXM5_PUNGR|nr:hypothetical protein CDL15_Pgr008825 [Punica granatum]
MKRSREQEEGKPCEICGDIGLREWIVTCSQCRAQEHQYCMHVPFSKDWKVWLCEPCQAKNKVDLPRHDSKGKTKSSGPSDISTMNQHYGTRVVGSSKARDALPRQANRKTVHTGKVKFLPLTEVMRVEREREGPSNPSTFSSRPRQDKPPPSFLSPRRTSRKSEYFRHRSPVKVIRERIPAVGKASRDGSGLKSHQQGPKVLKDRIDETVPAQQATREVNKEVLTEADPPSVETRPSSSLIKEKSIGRVSTRPIPSGLLHKSAFSSSRHCLSFSKPASADAAPEPDDAILECLRNQSEVVPWTGQFEFSASVIPAKRSGTFKAYFPVRVHRTAYEYSGFIPEVFPVELIPKCELRDSKIFRRIPDFHNAALLFYPDGSSEDYGYLCDLMNNQDYVIRGSVWDDVELLIFTSKHLPVDTQCMLSLNYASKYWTRLKSIYNYPHRNQKLWHCTYYRALTAASKTGLFLWGVYRSFKNRPAPRIRDSSEEICPSGPGVENPNNGLIAKTGGNEAAGRRGDEPNSLEESQKNPVIEAVLTRWVPPCDGWVKLNTGAVFRGDPGPAGGGGSVHGRSGKWIIGYVSNLGECKQLTANLWALLWGLNLVSERGYRKVQVETDSELALKCLNRVNTEGDVVGPDDLDLISSCRKLLLGDWEISQSHVSREMNHPAVVVANHFEDHDVGIIALLDSPPPDLAKSMMNGQS